MRLMKNGSNTQTAVGSTLSCRSLPPSPFEKLIQAAWVRGAAFLFAVDEKTARKASSVQDASLATAVQLSEAEGGGYLATIEMYHQLHCLV